MCIDDLQADFPGCSQKSIQPQLLKAKEVTPKIIKCFPTCTDDEYKIYKSKIITCESGNASEDTIDACKDLANENYPRCKPRFEKDRKNKVPWCVRICPEKRMKYLMERIGFCENRGGNLGYHEFVENCVGFYTDQYRECRVMRTMIARERYPVQKGCDSKRYGDLKREIKDAGYNMKLEKSQYELGRQLNGDCDDKPDNSKPPNQNGNNGNGPKPSPQNQNGNGPKPQPQNQNGNGPKPSPSNQNGNNGNGPKPSPQN